MKTDSQWVDENCRHLLRAEGERKLALAVLEDAIRCYQGTAAWTGSGSGGLPPNRLQARLRVQAEEWFYGPQRGPFCFARVCEVLGINDEWLREGLKKGFTKLPRGGLGIMSRVRLRAAMRL